MKKILIVATVQSHIAQFHKGIINELKKNGYEVHIAAKNNLHMKKGLELDNVDKLFDIPFERSPFDRKNIKAYKQLKKIIHDNNYDIVQCNTPVGGILARLACRKLRKNGIKVIYLAHGFHFYKGAPKKNWIVYYPIEKFFSIFTDLLITINLEDYEFAKNKFKCHVDHIYGTGVSGNQYYIHNEKEKKFLQDKYFIENSNFNIICIGELNDNKNQIVLIRAIKSIIDNYPNIRVFLAGNGPNELNLRNEIEKLNLENIITFLGYTRELEYIIPACDCIVSCSKREGLGLNIIEGMLCGKPAIASENRGHREIIRNNINGFLFNNNDYLDCAHYIKKLYEDYNLLEKLSNNSRNTVNQYILENVLKRQKEMYLKVGGK